MEKQVTTQKMKRQRKFLLVLPLLVLPFITLIFWVLGGGQVQELQAQETPQNGFNLHLPEAKLTDDKQMNKMSYYNRAEQDSAKFRELRKNDPNYKNSIISDTVELLSQQEAKSDQLSSGGLNTSLYGSGQGNDPNTDKIYKKLETLNRELNKPVERNNVPEDSPKQEIKANYGNTSVSSSDVDRLEEMMDIMTQPEAPDPELEQLNSMLEKILDVQHPERVQEKLKQLSEARREQLYEVSTEQEDDRISLMHRGNSVTAAANGFYSLDDEQSSEQPENTIQAVIHESQTVVNGSTVKLRLVNDVFIKRVHIPKDNFVFGIASLSGERLHIKINSIRNGNSLFPVELSVYDMDGLDGIYIPGAITRDVAKQSADRSMQNIGLTSLDPSWQAQAAGAGIETAKSLFSKKVKLIKVTLKAGYQVLLRDEKQTQINNQ
ncbi:conjugative transposon protein TraM [Autumnicola musiva]|uniref:Conjugative transposon protein TraM n=1 Tax=Autumnicola musiva TaxID=3075589 RepID=A0ABU3D698_9FLAO|nr:conjugative transposon protein TraM [Zunongwangia sp. F117]MDT0677048.1 conjugative transposon protein TraM [Zunongwangia sp. F117]